MVTAVAEHGYGETTVAELVRLAGVSKSTFYEHYEDKQDCFLATFDGIIDRLSQRLTEAYQRPGDLRQKLAAALGVFMFFAVEEPASAALIAVDALTLGAAGVEHRERASERFEALLHRGLARASEPERLPANTARLLVNGVRGVAYWRLRAGAQAELPGLVEPLVDWALSYQQPEGELTRRAVAAAAEPAPPPPPPEDPSLPGWDEPPDSPRSRRALTQRERIVRAAARVVYERNYEALSIPAISSAAGVSNQTFYEHFENKRDAFIGAFEELFGRIVLIGTTAITAAGNRPEALGIGMRAVLESIAADEIFAKVAFFELAVAGPVALDRGDEALGAFTSYLHPELRPSQFTQPLPEVVREAIGAGIWGVLLYEISHGRLQQLPELAPEMTRLAVAPIEAR